MGHLRPPARFTAFGVDITHGRPLHPQTQGKCERFHRSFKVEVLNRSTPWLDLAHCQTHFDTWRESYNHVRPHQALDLATPASRYRPSPRSQPASLPFIEYLPDDLVRIVKSEGEITFQNHFFFIGQAFAGLPVALRPALPDGRFDVFFSWKNSAPSTSAHLSKSSSATILSSPNASTMYPPGLYKTAPSRRCP